MEKIFGDVTPILIMAVVSMLVQFVKAKTALDGIRVQFVALGFSVILIGLYQMLYSWPESATVLSVARLAFASLIYSILGWFTSIGMYEVGSRNYQAVLQTRIMRAAIKQNDQR